MGNDTEGHVWELEDTVPGEKPVVPCPLPFRQAAGMKKSNGCPNHHEALAEHGKRG